MTVRIGTRGSRLAQWQAEWLQERLEELGCLASIRIFKTSGDRLAGQPPAPMAGKGIFVREIEEALQAEAIDVAVHSLKDLPVEQPPGLAVIAVPPREDARDVLISRERRTLAQLPSGSVIGTGSARRASQLLGLRPDLRITPLRGNLDTRLRKLDRGDCEALVLAAAGVHRLGLEERVAQYFSIEEICPAVGQGALAVETREKDESTRQVVLPLDDASTHLAVRAERALLRELGGGCLAPIAGYACYHEGEIKLTAVVASPAGQPIVRGTATGRPAEPESLGAQLAGELIARGAAAVLRAARAWE